MELFEYLDDCQRDIGIITIDDDFIEYRNAHKEKFNANGRNTNERLMHADCLIVEYTLIKNRLVEPPKNIAYDFSIGDNKIDAKIITSKYFNISNESLIWYRQNILSGDVTHFAFYKYQTNPLSPLKAGDEIKLQFIDIENARTVIKNTKPSNYKGYYYIL